ncbi:unnamed protein product [Linum tenue]|uniref:Auxin efflux carrier family protein n=1 Tax=Linum tenue TaxID=586396 RepID=A0AAV0PUV0_9ROSI|nr:unnamed protein product [Linum tenue]
MVPHGPPTLNFLGISMFHFRAMQSCSLHRHISCSPSLLIEGTIPIVLTYIIIKACRQLTLLQGWRKRTNNPSKSKTIVFWVLIPKSRRGVGGKMGFWTLLQVASMPVIQVLVIGLLGALLATGYCNVLHADARNYLNKVVFTVFTPSLLFSILSKTVTLDDIISWWFMPVNIGLTMLFGGLLGWLVVKVLRPKPHLEGLVIATCATGNYGNLLLIVLPAICKEDGTPFGEDHATCGSIGLSYASFSAALGSIYVWTIAYQLVRTSAIKLKQLDEVADELEASKLLNDVDQDANLQGSLLLEDARVPKPAAASSGWSQVVEVLHRILHELTAPPTLATIFGFLFGATAFLRNLIVGEGAPLRVIQDSIALLGDGAIPSITLILGGNLTQGKANQISKLGLLACCCFSWVFLFGN